MNVAVFSSSLVIGVITFAISLAGVYIGHAFGTKYSGYSGLLGGIILIAIGLKILIEGLFG